LKYFVFFLIYILFSCTKGEKVIGYINFDQYSNLCKQYKDYEIAPFRGKLRVVVFPDKSNMDFIDSGNGDLNMISRSINRRDSLRYQTEIIRIRKIFNASHVIAFFSNKEKTEIFLTKSDTTFSEFEGVKGFYHNEFESDTKGEFRYVLIHVNDKSQKKNVLEQLEAKYRINCIDSSWYYYRSFRFNTYKEF